jgi:hypothetical protein
MCHIYLHITAVVDEHKLAEHDGISFGCGLIEKLIEELIGVSTHDIVLLALMLGHEWQHIYMYITYICIYI